MGKSWDNFKPKEYQEFSEKWGKQAIRVLKPGGYLLAFSGTRTYHRMVVGLEDAGFEIKDQIDWVYGNGFPKSHNIGKAVDELQGNKREVIDTEVRLFQPSNSMGGGVDGQYKRKRKITKGNTKWEGFGTALKPAHEPIVLAQKPKEGTYAENVLKYGVGGLNIDGCRIGNETIITRGRTDNHSKIAIHKGFGNELPPDNPRQGRFPANLILDPESAKMLDEQSGISRSSGGRSYQNTNDMYSGGWSHKGKGIPNDPGFGDKGGASRFFYCPKVHKSERNAGLEDLEDVNYGQSGGARQKLKEGKDEYLQDHIGLNKIKKVKNDIATLKPINLMRYLVRLVTPPEGTVLDPFAGSGTTGIACVIEGFDYILIEKRKRFAKVIAPKRIEYWSKEKNWKELGEHKELPDPKERKIKGLDKFV